MSLFHQILDEHKELLKSKGYTEEALNSPDKPGWFMRMFALQFSMSKQNAHLYNEKEHFDLKAVGFFNDDRDIVVFKFNYQYDPESLELGIKRMIASMEGSHATYELRKNEDLPSSSVVYKELVQMDKLIRKADESLQKLGYYDSPFITPKNYLSDCMKSAINKLDGEAKMGTAIYVEAEIPCNTSDSLRLTFSYQYRPFHSEMHLEGIHAKLGREEQYFHMPDFNVLPTAQEVFSYMSNATKVEKARNVLQGIQDNHQLSKHKSKKP